MGWFASKKGTKITKDLLDAENDGEIVFDQRGIIKYVNRSATQMTGYSSDDAMIGGKLFDIVVLEDRKKSGTATAETQIIEAVNVRTRWKSRDFVIISARGGVGLAVELTLSPFLSDEEQLFSLKLRNLTEDLERERAQSEFVATASHEMRTPVAVIQGYLDLALNPRIARVDAKARKFLEEAQGASVRLGELFKNLLAVSRSEDGRVALKLREIEINSSIRGLKGDFELLAQEKHQQFVLDLDTVEVFCRLDFAFFQDIISNLVENSIKYTPEGGKIELKTEVDGSSAKISVIDNGAGIGEKDLPHIFDKFFRADNTSSRVGGTGLGLYLVKQRVEAMGGQIEVKSEVGKGSIFTVVFPVLGKDSRQGVVNEQLSVKQIEPISKEELETADQFKALAKDVSGLPLFIEGLGSKPFIKLAEKWRNGEIPSSSAKDREIVYNDTRKVNEHVPIERFNMVWQKFDKKLDNPGLTQLMKTAVGTPMTLSSQFIIPWMLTSPSAASWDFGFGYGYDFEGNWRAFPHTDSAYSTAVRDPVFSWIRERAILARKEIANKDKVLFLYAGVLPELRNVAGYPMPKEIWACDNDANLNTRDIFGWSTAEHNVHYEIMRVPSYIEKMIVQGVSFDTIVMNGASLLHYDEFDGIFEGAVKLLKPGGKLVFDVQLEHWDLIRAWFIFGIAPGVAPSLTNLEGAIERMSKICSRLPNVRLEYALDSRNKPPTAVMFYIIDES